MKRIEMNSRIEQQLKGQTRCVIKELNLDMCRAQQIEGLTDEFVNLQVLSMNNVGLITLDGFPRLPALRKLELSDNRLSGGLMNLVGCPNLTYLNLSGNKIKDLDQLEPLLRLENLRKLDLYNCEVTNIPQFRERVFQGLPNLKYLDGIDRDGHEDEMADEEDDEIDEEEEEENDEFIVKDDGQIPDEFYQDDEEDECGDEEEGEVEVEELEVDRGKDEKGRIEDTMEM